MTPFVEVKVRTRRTFLVGRRYYYAEVYYKTSPEAPNSPLPRYTTTRHRTTAGAVEEVLRWQAGSPRNV